MAQKLFRDSLYDYITIDLNKHRWLLELINTPEVQRLRHISQLGLSQFTYLGSVHSRLSHSMGVFHLMGIWLSYLERDYGTYFEDGDKDALLAASLLHDIGHGPFSHATENFFGDHVMRSTRIILDPQSSINKVLRSVNAELPGKVAGLIAKQLPEGAVQPRLWQKALISSQLDADRLDFLRRDSLFSGAEYGNFDWNRIIHTTCLKKYPGDIQRTSLFWPDKTKYAIEEYLFSRFYMYQSVYFHHTTRGFEKLLLKILERAKQLAIKDSCFANKIFPSLKVFFEKNQEISSAEFLTLTDYVLLAQITEWKQAEDSVLQDLVNMLFIRGDKVGFKVAYEFAEKTSMMITDFFDTKLSSAKECLQKNKLDPDYYLLSDECCATVYEPYSPEPETEEMSSENAIQLAKDSSGDVLKEISRELTRLQQIATKSRTIRYYCPYKYKEKISNILK